MLLRLVEAFLKPGTIDEFRAIYRNKIIAVLEQTPGCLFAGLLQSVDKSNRLVSLTIWESKVHARSYVESGTFQKNLDLAMPFMEESSEWKIQLTKENTLNYEQVRQEPVIKSYDVAPGTGTSSISEQIPVSRSYLRVLSLNIIAGNEEEFKRIYHDEIQPELKNVPGFRYSFLIDNTGNNGEMLSFTIWDDLESVKMYEQQGKFQPLLQKIQHTLSGLYQWKMALEKQEGSALAVSSRDIDISKFTLVTGEKFK